MKKMILVAAFLMVFASPYPLAAEMGPNSKETLIAQENSDMKRALYELQRDLQILNRRLDRLDEKIERIDRDVKDLKIR